MTRPKCPRLIQGFPNTKYFKPRAIPLSELEEVALTFDEFEAIRLADLEGLYQEVAASKMKISRPTFGRIIESAHKKVADALINGKAIKIEGGVIKMAQKRLFHCSDCDHYWEVAFGTGRPEACPNCMSTGFSRADSNRGPGNSERGRCRRHGDSKIAATNKEDK
jgi:predicted DNA-binding protein (UPF0251 family)